MIARLTFVGLAVFWLTMNVLLWRAEFGSRGGDTPVPVRLVCQKILTAPDASSLTVYQDGERMGYCEFSTGIGREMAEVDADKPPPEGLVKRAGYQVHIAGNVAFNGFTNRVKFNGNLQFSNARQWRRLDLKISTQHSVVEIHSVATNQSVHFKVVNDGAVLERDFTFDELQNPVSVVRGFAGNIADPLVGALDLPGLSPVNTSQSLEWHASRTRVKIGNESVPIYRLETSVLGRNITVDISTLGEVLRVELPGNVSARIDEWNRP
jgi:hypothetical protein